MSQLLGTKLVVTCVVKNQWLLHYRVSLPSRKLPPACSIQLTVQCASPRSHLLGLLDPRAEGKGPCDRKWPGLEHWGPRKTKATKESLNSIYYQGSLQPVQSEGCLLT